MSKATDQAYLLRDQYQNADNLSARIALHARFSTNPYGWQRWVFDQLEPGETCRLLELGCGPSHLWLENQGRVLEGWNITSSDFSRGMLEAAQRNLATGHAFTFEIIDAQAIPFEDESFDAVIANHMLHHVPDKAQALSEIRRVLRPDGKLYAATNGQSHLQELFALRRRFEIPGFGGDRQAGPAHLSFTLENGLERLTPWFGSVRLRYYEDALHVSEAEPLIDYIRSGLGLAADDQLWKLRQFIEQELAQRGAIHITKSAGMFIGEKPGS